MDEGNSDGGALLTPSGAVALGLDVGDPGSPACPHCGAPVEPLGVTLGGRVAWVAHARCGCGGEEEADRRAAEGARRASEEAVERKLAAAGVPRRFRDARAESAEIARYLAGFPHAD